MHFFLSFFPANLFDIHQSLYWLNKLIHLNLHSTPVLGCTICSKKTINVFVQDVEDMCMFTCSYIHLHDLISLRSMVRTLMEERRPTCEMDSSHCEWRYGHLRETDRMYIWPTYTQIRKYLCIVLSVLFCFLFNQ